MIAAAWRGTKKYNKKLHFYGFDTLRYCLNTMQCICINYMMVQEVGEEEYDDINF